MVAYWDGDARNVVANAAHFEWFGLTSDQMSGRPVSQVLGDATYRLILPYFVGALRGDAVVRPNVAGHLGPSAPHASVLHSRPIERPRVGFFALATDVTARVEAEESVEQYRAFARSLASSFVVHFDLPMRYLLVEGPRVRDFSLSSDETQGPTLWNVAPDLADELEPRDREALSGESHQWTRSVSGRIYELTSAPVTHENGDLFARMITGRDITEQRRLEVTGAALRSLAMAAARRAPWTK